MNENKRFILVKCYNEQWGVVDRSLEGTDQLVLITTNKSGTLYLINELNALNNENKQLNSEKQAITDILDDMEYGDDFWDRDYLIERISDIETAIGVDFE